MSTEPSHVDTGAEVAGTEVDKINTGALGTLIAVGLFAMLSITAAVTALVRHDLDIEQESKDANASQVVNGLKAAQQKRLNGTAEYVDRGKGVVSLPIALAKGLVVGELSRDPNSATPPATAPANSGVQVTSATVDGGAPGATLSAGGAASTAPDASKVGAPAMPEQGREVVKRTPASSAQPAPIATPTAATPGAASPGPTNK